MDFNKRLYLKKNNIIEAILPLLSIKGELGTVYNSLPFGSYGIYSLNKYSQKILEHYNSLVYKKDFLVVQLYKIHFTHLIEMILIMNTKILG